MYNTLLAEELKNLKICVVGLGLIGGSLCLALKRAGLSVDGANRSKKALDYALNHGVIDGEAVDILNYDVVFVALPPTATINYLTSTNFKRGALVCDICGVKQVIERAVYSSERNFYYVGAHPMAGKEVSGVENACADMFDRASMVITHGIYTNERALTLAKELTKAMGFARIVECSAEVHDKKIAYTSQLAHIVSNAYVKNSDINACFGFTGGSFQDMTRIAGVDERVWAELYLDNRENLSRDIVELIASLTEIKEAINGGDKVELEGVLANGRRLFEDGRDVALSEDIVVTYLK